MMNLTDKYLLFINKTHPELTISKKEIIESGFHSTAIIINNTLVFRFPLKKEFYDEYIHEVSLLKKIRKHISVPIPDLKLHQTDDFVFTEHTLIEGTQYSQLKSPLSKQEKEQLADDLALFLKELHNCPTDLPICQFSAEEYGISEETIKRTRALSNEEKTNLLNILRTFETYDLKEYNIVLSHTDLNENNFLLKENRLVGVIDFGNACRRDLSSEFATLMKWDFDLVQRIAVKYEEMTGKSVDLSYALLLQKIRCYGGILESEENGQSPTRYRRWLERLKNIHL